MPIPRISQGINGLVGLLSLLLIGIDNPARGDVVVIGPDMVRSAYVCSEYLDVRTPIHYFMMADSVECTQGFFAVFLFDSSCHPHSQKSWDEAMYERQRKIFEYARQHQKRLWLTLNKRSGCDAETYFPTIIYQHP